MKKLCIIAALMLCAAMLFGCAPEGAVEQPPVEAPAETPAGAPAEKPAEGGEALDPASKKDVSASLAYMISGGQERELAAWQEFTGTAAIMDGENEVPVAVKATGEDGCLISVGEYSDEQEYLFNFKSYVGDVDTSDGYTELIVTGDCGSDDYVTFIYRVQNGELKPASLGGCALGIYGDGTLLVDGCVDVLGTYGARCEWAMEPNAFNFERSSVYARVMDDEAWEYLALTVKKDGLPVRSAADGAALTLPAGTKLLMVMTDGESEAALVDEAGNYYLVSVAENETDGWGWMIDGTGENEWFENVPYAG